MKKYPPPSTRERKGQEGFLRCQTPTSTLRLKDEGCKVKNGGCRIKSEEFRLTPKYIIMGVNGLLIYKVWVCQ